MPSFIKMTIGVNSTGYKIFFHEVLSKQPKYVQFFILLFPDQRKY